MDLISQIRVLPLKSSTVYTLDHNNAMAVTEPASDAATSRDLQLQELIFSCCVCQATVSDVYAAPEHNKGFHSGSGDDDGVVIRLWIAECAHAFCGKHLEGGAAPFHPEGEQPVAPCPQCFRERGDDSVKRLFGIRGLAEGEHDPNIPADWFQCPPVNLDGTTPGMDAMRFQYMSLARYAQKSHVRWLDAEKNRTSAEQARAKERKYRKQLQTDLKGMEGKAISSSTAMEKAETQLKKWRDRQPVINHYLGMVKTMADDMAQMRAQLVELGYALPERDYSFNSDTDGASQKGKANRSHLERTKVGALNSSSSTAVADRMELSSSSLGKRKREGQNRDSTDRQMANDTTQHRTSSRDMMPPPFLKTARPHCRGSSSQFITAVRGPPTHRDDAAKPFKDREAHIIDQRRSQGLQHENWQTYHEPQAPRQHTLHQTGPARSADCQVYHALPVETKRLNNSFEDFSLDSDSQPGYVHQGVRQPLRQEFASGSRSDQISHRHQADDPSAMYLSKYGYHAVESVGQKDSYFGREPLQEVPVPQHAVHQSALARQPFELSRGQLSTPAPHKPPRSSIVSPFFRMDAHQTYTTASPKSHAPPTRGSIASQRASFFPLRRQPELRQPETVDQYTRSYPTLYRDRSPVKNSKYIGSSIAPSRTNELYSRQLTEASPAPRLHAVQESPFINQHAPRSQHFAISQQETAPFRSRITLPPSSARAKDGELSSIPGLRGGSSQPNNGPYMHRGPGYQDPRMLFSAAGRRSVRR